MNLTKALKEKKKLVKQADTAYSRFGQNNSWEPGVTTDYSPELEYENWLNYTNQLIELKSKIHAANVPISSKIFRLGELKNMISKARAINPKSGKITERSYNGSTVTEYESWMTRIEKDSIILQWEEEIEKIQEEIESFNAITKI
jgi:hypothetical protein